MKKSIWIGLVIVSMLVFASSVFALISTVPEVAFYTDEVGDTDFLFTAASCPPAGSCTPTVTSFVEWDTSSPGGNGIVDEATLTFTTTSFVLQSGDHTFTIFEASNCDPVNKTGTIGAPIDTITLSLTGSTADQAVVFTSDTDIGTPATSNLVDYANQQIQDSNAPMCIALQLIAASGAGPAVQFNDPTLNMLDPTAISFGSMSAVPQASLGWMAILLSVGLILLVITGAVWVKRSRA